ncbi:class I SAM-dependent methyltransferase [Flavobacteriaceae bacterium]|nr:class I SAM-dependent methyltransferase [Flavobacteriaceae bacterium]MDB2696260.1 class I SAM-dependent methyltransferase [Flavobacteriaceae bacterium]MDC6478504.1 methyltransferase domain-containing protein [Flavobacteriaceae bacterium]
MKKAPIEVFDSWVTLGKDEGMQKNHSEAVENMISFATKKLEKFSFIDAGCGNGWVVRSVSKIPNCISASGVDGAFNMIDKAKKGDPQNNYICENLLTWSPKEKVNLVHSMEVFYYLENPEALIQHIYSNWLKENARLIIGLDFYLENPISHSWPEECGISIMQLLSKSTWKNFFIQAGFKGVESWSVGAKENWSGTLVLTGTK